MGACEVGAGYSTGVWEITPAEVKTDLLVRKQGKARLAAAAAYPHVCCVVCGLELRAVLTVAHLDHQPGNNDPDNLVFLCHTHHWMFDACLYPVEAIRLLRAHWQMTKGVPSHTARMKDAGARAAATRKRSAGARKAWATRRTTEPEAPGKLPISSDDEDDSGL